MTEGMGMVDRQIRLQTGAILLLLASGCATLQDPVQFNPICAVGGSGAVRRLV